jgi:putative aldouronate transport system permease protein
MSNLTVTEINQNIASHRLSTIWNLFFHFIVSIFTLACIFPFIFIIIISLTDEKTLALDGYKVIPAKFSTFAYEYIIKTSAQLITSYGVSLFITVVGTIVSLVITSLFSYAISRAEFRYRRLFSMIALLPLLFNAGIVPSYIVTTQFLHLKDTIGSLIMPLLVGSFYIFLMRSFFQTTVPEGIVESARIDGAGEFKVFYKIVVPISLPIFATIALFTSLNYWNDWFNALLYIDNPKLIPVQYLLIAIQNNVQFLAANTSLLSSGVVENLSQLPSETLRMVLVVLVAGPVTIIFPFFQKYFVQGLTGGAIKE